MSAQPAARMPTPPRLWPGVLFAPAVAPFAVVVLLRLDALRTGTPFSGNAAVEVLAWALVVGVPLAYAAMVAAMPALLWLRRRGRLDAVRVGALGAAVGAGSLVAAFALVGARLAFAVQVVGGALTGLAVAAVFCLLCGIGFRAR